MEQQAWILRSFLAQVEEQEDVGEESPNGIFGEFVRLKNQSTKYRNDRTFPSKTAERQENIKKNRYKDIVPFDHSRVTLTVVTSENDTDYINASFIKGVNGSRAYIATQGPLPHTVLDFLRMLWEYNVQVVVMACREFEMGKRKCERYWPQTEEGSFVCEPFTVYCDSEENKGDYLTRTLRVTYHNLSRTLKQLHYVNWPDHGVPDSIPPILDMLHEMRSYQSHDDIPICIHCSAGCGRTGALCVIDYTWNLLKKQMIAADFNIYDLVHEMRTQRPSLVQTKEQYDLVYRTIKLLFERYLQSLGAQIREHEVSLAPPSITLDIESYLPDLSKDLDLQSQFQQLLDEERELLTPQQTILPSASDGLLPLIGRETQWDQQQYTHLLQTLPQNLTSTRELTEDPKTSPAPVHGPVGVEHVAQEGDDTPSPTRPALPAVAAAVRLMVEDPYFGPLMPSPLSAMATMESAEDTKHQAVSPTCMPSLSLNDQTLELDSPASGTDGALTDEDDPPPLPERTPESYILTVSTEHSGSHKELNIIIPSNAAAEPEGSPSSPAPPLPERTPESFELAADQAPMEVTPAVNLSRIGMSSEWSGDSKPAASQIKMNPRMGSKSLRVKPTFTATFSALSPTPSSNLHVDHTRPDPMTPPRLPQSEESLTPLMLDRTPESSSFTTQEVHGRTAACQAPAQPSMKAAMAAEYDGSAQPKRLLNVVKSRSKSVRACPKQEGERDVSRRPTSLNAETPGVKSDRDDEVTFSRTKSLKLFRHKQKPQTQAPAQPGTSANSNGALMSVFKFGFGNRFRKPKGPRNYPETWL